MLMFRFWGSDSRGSDKTEQIHQSMFDFGKAGQPLVSATSVTNSARSPKRRRQSNAAIASHNAATSPAVKRPREDDATFPRKKIAVAKVEDGYAPQPASKMVDLERAREVIQLEFNHAILLKHDELRLINQEIAKCQIALEQLRRCHLIPYPVNVPTPNQMLNISNGSGPAVHEKSGDTLPQWAPPFGITEGPYARHYAKWLIPDPKFDGIQPEVPTQAESSRFRSSMEGRTTRHGVAEVGGLHGKGRAARGNVGHKLQSLSSGYPQPKDKAGPCVLKRGSDGKTVKLVCLDCNRENFSSTQGFINHCRIAHKRDFKSHEEAAVACGHPIEVSEGPVATVSNSNSSGAHPMGLANGLVHPFAREDAMSEACSSVVARIESLMELYRNGQLPGVTSIPGVPNSSAGKTLSPPSKFSASSDSPHLSRLLQERGVNMNLGELVRDAKTKVDFALISSPEDEDEETDASPVSPNGVISQQAPSLVPGMRVPARTAISPVPVPSVPRPSSSKGRISTVPYATPLPTPAPRTMSEHEPEIGIDDMDMDMSPNTVSNNAPSLVSDDGEYDDSVDGSSDEAEVNDDLDAESVSDVAEIGFDDDHVGGRSMGHHRASSGAGTGTTVRLHKEDSKHVTFVSPVKDNANQRRGRRVN
ncbi:uncharacterized protein BCR38DRAFT_341675 [Pseudomassariella vexata]|uniref:AHC1-like C2H2 zinc-finger domain-containing protein n=1 Tax=Pseudomassariella vexata TaxID=1141098 RepID=A0A1Y2E0P0_9PEZI|nr:uncharacterized protein BCR38DRAFT_341675 [Pseudomassariella vexata]ORY65100.1 hypothetical protein BCR38DRAFT_341675 [Pseudomassariella vexata]